MESRFERERLEYLQDGKTTRQEIVHRLGYPPYRFENERIAIYVWSEQGADYTGTYNIVLIFDDNEVLERHSIVRVK